MRFIGMVLILIALLVFSACDCFGGVTESIDDAVTVIDNAIEDISSDSASWQTILQRVANELPEDISEIIRSDAQNLATRSIAATGTEFRCNVDFLANRAIAALRNLKAKLLGEDPPLLPPAFCQVVPSSIDLEISPTSWSIVTLHGYDLDHRDRAGNRLRVLMLDEQGAITQLDESRIGRTTHYQITLNLGDMARQLHQDKIVKLLVEWDGSTDDYPEIVVIPWIADTMLETVNVGRTTYMPPHTWGDRDFSTDDDEHMSIDVRGILDIEESWINCQVYMKATAEGWSNWARAYTAPFNWRIIDVRPSMNSRQTANITVHGDITYYRPTGEVVTRFIVWGDRDGDEAGTWTKVEVHWTPLNITLEEIAPEWLR
jgi:hypothetical protein